MVFTSTHQISTLLSVLISVALSQVSIELAKLLHSLGVSGFESALYIHSTQDFLHVALSEILKLINQEVLLWPIHQRAISFLNNQGKRPDSNIEQATKSDHIDRHQNQYLSRDNFEARNTPTNSKVHLAEPALSALKSVASSALDTVVSSSVQIPASKDNTHSSLQTTDLKASVVKDTLTSILEPSPNRGEKDDNQLLVKENPTKRTVSGLVKSFLFLCIICFPNFVPSLFSKLSGTEIQVDYQCNAADPSNHTKLPSYKDQLHIDDLRYIQARQTSDSLKALLMDQILPDYNGSSDLVKFSGSLVLSREILTKDELKANGVCAGLTSYQQQLNIARLEDATSSKPTIDHSQRNFSSTSKDPTQFEFPDSFLGLVKLLNYGQTVINENVARPNLEILGNKFAQLSVDQYFHSRSKFNGPKSLSQLLDENSKLPLLCTGVNKTIEIDFKIQVFKTGAGVDATLFFNVVSGPDNFNISLVYSFDGVSLAPKVTNYDSFAKVSSLGQCPVQYANGMSGSISLGTMVVYDVQEQLFVAVIVLATSSVLLITRLLRRYFNSSTVDAYDFICEVLNSTDETSRYHGAAPISGRSFRVSRILNHEPEKGEFRYRLATNPTIVTTLSRPGPRRLTFTKIDPIRWSRATKNADSRSLP